MKWVTRERARVDRIACPWLISRFVDREPVWIPSTHLLGLAFLHVVPSPRRLG